MRTVQYKRKKQGRTNYKNRLNLLVSRQNRVVIRKSLTGIQIQIVEYLPDGDKVLLSVHSRELKSFGLPLVSGNIPVAYLTGLLCGKKALKKNISSGIVDLGLQRAHPKGKLFAAVKGLLDSGFTIPCDESVLPSEAVLNGELLESYAQKIKGSSKPVFTAFSKNGVDASTISKVYADVKSKILAEK